MMVQCRISAFAALELLSLECSLKTNFVESFSYAVICTIFPYCLFSLWQRFFNISSGREPALKIKNLPSMKASFHFNHPDKSANPCTKHQRAQQMSFGHIFSNFNTLLKRNNHVHNKLGITPQKIIRKLKSFLCSYNLFYLLSKQDDCTLHPSPANHLCSQGTSSDGLSFTVMTCARTKGHQLKLLGTRCRTAKRDRSSHRRQVCESFC